MEIVAIYAQVEFRFGFADVLLRSAGIEGVGLSWYLVSEIL